MEKRMRTHEAREEERKEQEKKMYEEDDEDRVPVVPNMEAGGSYLRTTYPRDVVVKIVTDELEGRKAGRGTDGLVRG